MHLASISENKLIEKRIAITPEIAKKYINLGFSLSLPNDYGNHLGFKNDDYKILGVNLESDEQKILLNKKKLQVDKNFGYVFQTSRLLPWLTVKENIELVCDGKESQERIDELLINFNLSEFQNYYPKSISGGMRRKVSLARALVRNPKVLLMDEPFISLDQPTSENLYNVLVSYRKKKPITVIFITHMLKEAILLGDRILFFSKKPGTVVFDYRVKSIRKPLTLDNKSVDSEYKKLKSKYPQLLEGLV